jgi:hypothetical protein
MKAEVQKPSNTASAIINILPLHHSPASALGSLPGIALSSGRVIDILPGKGKFNNIECNQSRREVCLDGKTS